VGLRIKIAELESGQWFEFEVDPDAKLWGRSSALKQIFDELKLPIPQEQVGKWALFLGKEVVPHVPESNKTWSDIEGKQGDEYCLAFIRAPVSRTPTPLQAPTTASNWGLSALFLGMMFVAGSVVLSLMPLLSQSLSVVSPDVAYLLKRTYVSVLLLAAGVGTVIGIHGLAQAT
jgi:hypothetical protein